MIYIINGTTETAVTELITASLTQGLDGTDELSVTLTKDYVNLIDDETQLRCNGQLYTIKAYTKSCEGESPICDVQAEHISYELNDYVVETFAHNDTPAHLMEFALDGTPFELGTVEPTGTYHITLGSPASCKGLLNTIAATVGGELTYSDDGTTVNLVNHRGATTPIDINAKYIVTGIAYTHDITGATESYDVSLGHKSTLVCGDEVKVKHTPLGLNTTTRIISITYNPYNPYEVSIEVGDYVMDIVDAFINDNSAVDRIIQTFSVSDGEFISRIEVEQLISSIEQSADRLAWMIASGESASSMVLTDRLIEVISQAITITGFVTIRSLEELGGVTTINGSTMHTNHLIGQSELTGLEFDVAETGDEIHATVSLTGTTGVRVTLDHGLMGGRTFDVVARTPNRGYWHRGQAVAVKVRVAAGQTTGTASLPADDWESAVFALSGTNELTFRDNETSIQVSATASTVGLTCTVTLSQALDNDETFSLMRCERIPGQRGQPDVIRPTAERVQITVPAGETSGSETFDPDPDSEYVYLFGTSSDDMSSSETIYVYVEKHITATVTERFQSSRWRFTVTLSEGSVLDRGFAITIQNASGTTVGHTYVTVESGELSGYSDVTGTTSGLHGVFDASGSSTYTFVDGQPHGVAVTGDLFPSADSAGPLSGYSLGTGARRWKDVYTYSGVVSGSARSLKYDIADMDERHDALFDGLRPRTFSFRNGQHGRAHYGLIVDELGDAISGAGMTAADCAAYCLDDPNDPNGTGGIRYEELIALCVRQIQALKEEIKIMKGSTK